MQSFAAWYAEFASHPLAMLPSALSELKLMSRVWGAQAPREPMAGPPRADMRAHGAIAVIPVAGVLSQKDNWLSSYFGWSTCRGIQKSLALAVSDPSVGAIMLEFDSPGGSVFGIAELAAAIGEARAQKPVAAYVNSLCASAAYWLACACDSIMVTQSGQVGSIGVYMEHDDVSGMLDAQGVKVTLVSAGKFKTEGNPYEPLSAEARQAMQDAVDIYYAAFVKAVAAGRSTSQTAVRDGMGQGRVLDAARALKANMVDGIATMDGAVSKLGARMGKGRNARADNALPEPLTQDPVIPDPLAPELPAQDPVNEPATDESAPADPSAAADIVTIDRDYSRFLLGR